MGFTIYRSATIYIDEPNLGLFRSRYKQIQAFPMSSHHHIIAMEPSMHCESTTTGNDKSMYVAQA
jgi:hypothetical protein